MQFCKTGYKKCPECELDFNELVEINKKYMCEACKQIEVSEFLMQHQARVF